jgi:hypothetical protein
VTVSGTASRGIFLSYRREDAAPYARLLQYQMAERLPMVPVFMDLDSIEPGLDFADVIGDAIGSCSVLLALIGRRWTTLVDEDGSRRLDNPDDLVRFEIETALARGIRVIPVLVDEATPVRRQQLPPELHKLARLNAIELSYGRYQYDADRLLDLVRRLLDAATEAPPAQVSGPVSGSNLPYWTAADADLAREVWSKLSQPAKRLVSVLVDSPDEHFDGDELAERAGIPNGRQGVAGALGWPGRYCLAVGRRWFWSWEDPDGSAPGYWLTPDVAELFRVARDES